MPSSDPWRGLLRELDLWAADGRKARLWLRDDDAVESGPGLDRLLDITGRRGVPVLLAVIPQPAQSGLADRLGRAGHVTPCQHGYAHRNHAATAEKKQELGAHRPLATVLDELREGRERLAGLFGEAVHPVLVPPWNRIAPAVAEQLPKLGFRALSCFGGSPRTAGIRRIDCDVDIIDWKGGRGGRDPAAIVDDLIEVLSRARRDGGRPVGILSHHLVHDATAWTVLEDLMSCTQGHAAAQWVSFVAL